jgi:hypothetical protein
MGCFLFGLIFSGLSLFLSMGDFGVGHGAHADGGPIWHLVDGLVDALDGPGHHGLGHGTAANGHGPVHTGHAHGGPTHAGHVNGAGSHAAGPAADQPLGGLSPFNMPTILAG